jgi:hypothetical protein
MTETKLSLLEKLLEKVTNNILLIECYINRNGDCCSIGYLLQLCGIENKIIKILNTSHINKKKIICIIDIMNKDYEDFEPKSINQISYIQDVLHNYNFTAEELYDIQHCNDYKTQEDTTKLIKEIIDREKLSKVI